METPWSTEGEPLALVNDAGSVSVLGRLLLSVIVCVAGLILEPWSPRSGRNRKFFGCPASVGVFEPETGGVRIPFPLRITPPFPTPPPDGGDAVGMSSASPGANKATCDDFPLT